MTESRGFGLVEALVGVALGALAVGVLASSVSIGARALVLARGTGAQIVAAHDGLERLRHHAPGTIDDVVEGHPSVTRQCVRGNGRGRVDPLAVDTIWTAGSTSHPFAAERAP